MSFSFSLLQKVLAFCTIEQVCCWSKIIFPVIENDVTITGICYPVVPANQYFVVCPFDL